LFKASGLQWIKAEKPFMSQSEPNQSPPSNCTKMLTTTRPLHQCRLFDWNLRLLRIIFLTSSFLLKYVFIIPIISIVSSKWSWLILQSSKGAMQLTELWVTQCSIYELRNI